ncbi:hypothetical protein [Bythopirellula goksoeyrii]|uniref:Uncharacterized protein n=1 Tax=Bythopirellula goksoeyrii TaxID=1400387 RepID=A0A5B9QDX3_9BACT|nr:hypothetical protein [Bythopirellula goksoeyrii]QEG35136.1 hypothetical protein Pr1d_24270 [Bythopirellula goksoeyrii]
MVHTFLCSSLVVTLLSISSGCQGCRESSSSPSQPAQQEADDSTSQGTQGEEASSESGSTESEESEGGPSGGENESETSDKKGDAGQAGDSETGGASGEGNESSNGNGGGSGNGSPANAPSGAGDSATGTGGVSQPTMPSPKFDSPEDALAYANRQREKSSELSKSGDNAEAYEQALQGWQSLQPHLADKACDELSEDLLKDLEKYGEGLGAKGIPIIGKPLKIK